MDQSKYIKEPLIWRKCSSQPTLEGYSHLPLDQKYFKMGESFKVRYSSSVNKELTKSLLHIIAILYKYLYIYY
jgi:hypothetical protein